MTKRQPPHTPPYFTVDYSLMGIMTLDEFKQAIWTDIEVLRDTFNVKYVVAPVLKLSLTNQFGDIAQLKSLSDGRPIYRMHTRHYRPACREYDP